MEHLLRCVLTMDPEQRMTPAEALRHPFLATDAQAERDTCAPTPPTATPTPTHPINSAKSATASGSAGREEVGARAAGLADVQAVIAGARRIQDQIHSSNGSGS